LFFFGLTLVFLFLFIKKTLKSALAATVLTWSALLSFNSINSWLALGPQEGIALCFFSLSLVLVSKFRAEPKTYWLVGSCLSLLAAALTKETFAFSFLIPIVIYFNKNKGELVKSHRAKQVWYSFLAVPLILTPLYLAKAWRLLEWKQYLASSVTESIPLPHTFVTYLEHVFASPSILWSLATLGVLVIYGLFKTFKNKERLPIPLVFTVAALALTMLFQLGIYSFTDYIAPHYVQPLSVFTIIVLCIGLTFVDKKKVVATTLFLALFLPASFHQTMVAANGHNYYSRMLHEIEQLVPEKRVNQVVFLGHRSYDHEAIYSFSSRLRFLYPHVSQTFSHLPSSWQVGEGVFDVGQEFEASVSAQTPRLYISFSDQVPTNRVWGELSLHSTPLVSQLEAPGTFYTVFPKHLSIDF
jgi:hypothetical protein